MNEKSLEMIELELALLVRRISTITTSKENGGLDRAAYLLLHQISTKGSAGVKVLGNELLLDISTVSRQAAALEQKGFVEKNPDPNDGRAYHYRITEQGAKDLSIYRQTRLNQIAGLLSQWTEEEYDMFGKLLKKFNQALK